MKLYDPKKFLLIAGPCMLENEAICREVAAELLVLQKSEPRVKILFSGSFDKANRTSIESERGPGLENGLALLRIIKKDYGFPVITDIHTPDQAKQAAEICDAIQIPAFLCRQTDLLVASAKTGKCVHVKKGQFLAPQDMRYVVQKLEESGAVEIWQTERGTTFGYHNLVVDMRSFMFLKKHGHPVIFDATHSVQLPGGADGKSGGQREFVKTLAKAAIAAGAQGLYIETHPNPDKALSDGPSQVPLNNFKSLIEECLWHWH